MARAKTVEIRWITKNALKKVLDVRARRVTGLSGTAFRKKFSAKFGQKSLDRKAGVVELVTLCSFTRGKRASKNRKGSGG
jgi:hypothetical protein